MQKSRPERPNSGSLVDIPASQRGKQSPRTPVLLDGKLPDTGTCFDLFSAAPENEERE
jgi:hypothetical protein